MDIRQPRGLKLLAIALAYMWSVPAGGGELPANQILWMHPASQPINILEGPLAGLGAGDRALSFFQNRLPQYDHKLLVGNFKRIISMVSSGQQVCGATLLKNQQRSKTILYSEPYLLAPPIEIIVIKSRLKDFKPFMDENGTVSLVELLTKSDLVFGHSNGRSYSHILDEILNTYRSEANCVVTNGQDVYGSVIKMLDHKRFDYTIGFGYVVRYLQKQLALRHEMAAIPVREYTDHSKVYVGCPQTPWGEKLISELNAIILNSRQTFELYGVFQPWLDVQSWHRYVDALPTLKN